MPWHASEGTTRRMLAALEQAGDMGLKVAELAERTWGKRPTKLARGRDGSQRRAGINSVAGAYVCALVDKGLAIRTGKRANAVHFLAPAGKRWLEDIRRRTTEEAERRARGEPLELEEPEGSGPFFHDR